MENLTIKDIARMAGVSITAVSFVLNDKEGISDATRKKIKAIIDKTGFVPSMNSKRLILKKSFNISILINSTSSPFEDLFYFEVTRGILQKSGEYGYNIVISEVCKANNGGKRLPDIIYSNDTDGIIFLQDIEEDIIKEVEETGIPYLVVDSHSQNDTLTAIKPDYEHAVYMATSHLTGCGHRKIAFITSSFIPEFYTQTYGGLKKAMTEAKAEINSEFIQCTAADETSAYECMKKILSNKELPTAVVCSVDIFAIGAMKCIKDMGLKIPQDISVIGVDDIFLSSYTEPGLTTVKIDKLSMGILAMDMIVKKISGHSVKSRTIVPEEISVRASVTGIESKSN